MGKKLIGSQTEYNQLSKVILGRLDEGNQFPTNDVPMLLMIAAEEGLTNETDELDIKTAAQKVPQITKEMVVQTNKELEQLEAFFLDKGIEVVRPHPVEPEQEVVTRNFKTTQFPVYCPRDVIFNFRNLIIISPNSYQSRVHEADYYADILDQERADGRVVIFAPRPQLADTDLNFNADAEYVLNTSDPIFEAANVLIDGEHKAIYYQISNSGNEAGYEWLKLLIEQIYPDVTVHPLRVYKGTHLDTTIAILNYDVVALNPERIPDVNVLPEPLKKRKHIFPDLVDTRNPNGLSSKWIGMNSLSLSPDVVVVDADQKKYIDQLEQAGFDVFPHKLTYSDVIEGGHHCTSSDLRRSENY